MRNCSRKQPQFLARAWYAGVAAISACHSLAPAQPPVTSPDSLPRRVWRASQFVGLSGASVSTNGRYFLYTDWTTGDLVARDLRTGVVRNVTNKPADAFEQFAESFMRLSEDGSRFVYVWDRQPDGYELRTISARDSAPRGIYLLGHRSGRAYDLSRDGRSVAAVLSQRDPAAPSKDRHRIALISVDHGTVEVVGEIATAPERMRFSPDSRFLAYELAPQPGSQRDIFVVDVESGAVTASLTDSADQRLLGWSPTGSSIAVTTVQSGAAAAWTQPLENGRATGPARPLNWSLPDRAFPLGITSAGAFYFAVPETSRRLFTAELDVARGRLGSEALAVSPMAGAVDEGADWSPDGASIAYVRGGRALLVRDAATGAERVVATLQAVFTPGWGDRYVRWSPDRERLLVPQGGRLFLVNVATGNVAPLRLGIRARYGRWARDGRSIYYARLSSDTTTTEIVRRDLESQREAVIYRSSTDLARAHDDFHSLELSPDDEWLAFAGAAGTTELDTRIVVVSTNGSGPSTLLQVPNSEFLNVVGFTPDSRAVLFTRDGKFAAERSRTLWMIPVSGGVARPIELPANVLTSIRFHPDGRRVVFDSGERGAAIWMIDNLFARE